MQSFRDLITIAGCIFQALPVHDPYVTAAVFDQTALLQSACHQGDGGALCPQHLGKEFLSEIEGVAFDAVGYHE